MMFNWWMRMVLVSCCFATVAMPAAQAASEGTTLYNEYCLVCHGDKGDGNTRVRRGLSTPPRNFTTAKAHRELSRERMINSVTNGRPGTAMMPFNDRLDDDQIAAVVDYIRSTFMQGEGVADRPPELVRGEHLYVRNCAVCHGDKGSGAVWTQSSLNPSPRNFTKSSPTELTKERMIRSVTYGRPGTAMMSFRKRLSPDDINSVVDYIRKTFLGKALAAEKTQPMMQADMSLPFPKGLRGDLAKGKDFYEHNCFTCHGLEGNGQGSRAELPDPKPRNFLTPDARRRLNRPTLFVAVRDGIRGTVMPSWSKVISDQQIADVAEYVFAAFVHPQADEAHSAAPTGGADKKKP